MSTNICAFLFLYLYIVVVYVPSKTFRVLFCLFQIDVLLCFTIVCVRNTKRFFYKALQVTYTQLCNRGIFCTSWSHTDIIVTVVYFVPLKES